MSQRCRRQRRGCRSSPSTQGLPSLSCERRCHAGAAAHDSHTFPSMSCRPHGLAASGRPAGCCRRCSDRTTRIRTRTAVLPRDLTVIQEWAPTTEEELASGAGPAGVFPLRLGWQTNATAGLIAQAMAELRCLIPVDAIDRTVGRVAEGGWVVRHHVQPLRLGDGVFPEEEARGASAPRGPASRRRVRCLTPSGTRLEGQEAIPLPHLRLRPAYASPCRRTAQSPAGAAGETLYPETP